MSRVMSDTRFPDWHGTTILCVRKGAQVAMAGDGQVSLGQTVVKGNARKVRRIAQNRVLAGFAGATGSRRSASSSRVAASWGQSSTNWRQLARSSWAGRGRAALRDSVKR